MDELAIIDDVAKDRVLVFGSLPPDARDLDLLVTPGDRDAIAKALQRNGFERYGDAWIRFGECTARAVELVPADDWPLTPEEITALFDEAVAVEGRAHVVRPSPAHTLLILARKLQSDRTLSKKRRDRIDGALRDDDRAWGHAEHRAAAWRVTAGLRDLRRAYESGGVGRRQALRKPKRGAVVALSGLDGAGKSSQARALADALERVGLHPRVVWTPIGNSPLQQRIAGAVKVVVGRRPQESVLAANAPSAGAAGVTAAAWAVVGAGFNAAHHLQSALADVARGRIVIFDRYVLDSIVQLRFAYGHPRLPAQIVKTVSIRPAQAFLLDVAPETALARKDDRWTLDDLTRQAQLYREEASRLGVTRLDGERPREDLCAEIARHVYASLVGRPNE